jgi:chromosome segregation ATPase
LLICLCLINRTQVADLKAQLRKAEQKTIDEQTLRQRGEAQLSTLVYNLDKAEAALKQKNGELASLRAQATSLTQSIEEMKATIQQQVL